MAIIGRYTPRLEFCGPEGPLFAAEWNTFCRVHGGFKEDDPEAFVLLKFDPDTDFHRYLDAVTLAVERGLVHDRVWPTQLFATRQDLEGFIDGLGRHQYVRIHDRWFRALWSLADTSVDGVILVEDGRSPDGGCR